MAAVLKVSVDGATAIAKTLTANCDTVANCITAIGAITGATVTNVDNKIKITSSSTGTSSTIDIDASSGDIIEIHEAGATFLILKGWARLVA